MVIEQYSNSWQAMIADHVQESYERYIGLHESSNKTSDKK